MTRGTRAGNLWFRPTYAGPWVSSYGTHLGQKANNVRAVDEDNGQFSPITVRGNRVAVLNWETDDNDIVSFFQNKPVEDRPRAFERALKVGVVASNVVGTAERIDYVQKAFNSLQTRFEQQLDRTLTQLGQTFDDMFGEKGKFARIIQDNFGDNGKLVKEIFDPAREGTPLYQLRVELERQITEVQKALARKSGAEEVVARTPVRGLEFEEEVYGILSRIVRQRKGDELEATGTTVGGLSKSKKGDFLIRFTEKPTSPLAIETKDEARISLPELNRTLEKTLENRGAAYAILVSKNVEALPDSVGWFNEYGNNKLVVALGSSGSDQLREEVLNIAITWARLRILLQTPTRVGVDAGKIAEAARKAETVIGRFREILTQCTNVEKASRTIRGLCEEIQQSLTTELTTISTLVSPPST